MSYWTNPDYIWGITVQWWIQDFPERGYQPLNILGKNLLFGKIFSKKCIKMKECCHINSFQAAYMEMACCLLQKLWIYRTYSY